MEFDARFVYQDQVISSVVVEGFVIPVRAVFDQKINMEKLTRLIRQCSFA